jgi:SAM-dependent methyltransferase
MTIARATLDDRSTVVSADLRTSDWTANLDREGYDAVLTATARHWLAPDRLSGVYREAHTLLRPGGVFVNADHMPDDALPTLSDLLMSRQQRRQDALARTGAATTWDGWWDLVAADDALAGLLPERATAFADRHPEETLPPVGWHVDAMRDAGYREVGLLWRGGTDAAIIGVK